MSSSIRLPGPFLRSWRSARSPSARGFSPSSNRTTEMHSSPDLTRSVMLDSKPADYAIRATNIGKTFPRYPSVVGMAAELLTGRSYHERKWVLQDVSFEVARGEVVGVIGSNGAGKSTLLKIIAGLLDSSTGTVDVRGRLSAILELGTGFDGNFTGRENVITGGMCLGMSREEVEARLPWIIEFSGLEAAIDSEFRTYSSGMRARLTFATAISIEPEILIVDEALAAGDSYFVHKCLRRIREICRSGATVMFVSHSSQLVAQLCKTAIWLEDGRIREMGPARDVVSNYDYDCHVRISEQQGKLVRVEGYEEAPDKHETSGHNNALVSDGRSNVSNTITAFRRGPVIIGRVRFLDKAGQLRTVFSTWEDIRIEVDYSCTDFVPEETLGLAIGIERAHDLVLVSQFSTCNLAGNETMPYNEAPFRRLPSRKGTISAHIVSNQFLAGSYCISLGLIANHPHNQEFYEYRHRLAEIRIVDAGFASGAIFYPN
ncbi:MAG: ABC transporter ATP-binding protein, partial [Hyphomicrobium sp.]